MQCTIVSGVVQTRGNTYFLVFRVFLVFSPFPFPFSSPSSSFSFSFSFSFPFPFSLAVNRSPPTDEETVELVAELTSASEWVAGAFSGGVMKSAFWEAEGSVGTGGVWLAWVSGGGLGKSGNFSMICVMVIIGSGVATGVGWSDGVSGTVFFFC